MAEGEPQTVQRIFISYRREDSTGFVRALLGPLRARFGRDRVFKDTDNIPPGQDFVKAIRRELESCKVLLAIIGNEWTNVVDTRTSQRRLENPNDTLRVEIAAALNNDHMTVIPVLVDRASMPRQEELPEELWDLTRRNAVELSDTRWDADVERLVRALEVICGDEPALLDDEPQDALGSLAGRGAAGEFRNNPVIDRLVLRRERQILEHIKTARDAYENEDYKTVLSESERAIWLDPECVEARDLAERAQAAIDEQNIRARLEDAERALTSGDLSAASESIDLALARNPEHPAALKLRQQLLKQRFDRDRQAEVTQSVAAELESARASLKERNFTGALSHVDEALALSPESADARDLRAQIVAAREDAVRARDHKRRAQHTIADAQAAWAAGRQEAALSLLVGFTPPHELVTNTIAEFRARIADADELRRKAEAAKHEAAALATQHAAEKLAQATAATREKRYDAARQLIEEARAFDPANPGLNKSEADITAAIAADEAAARDGQVRAAKAARRDAGAKLAQVSGALAARRYDAARELIAAAGKLDPGHPDLSLWPRRIDEAIAADEAAARARRDAGAKLALVADAIAGKQYGEARLLVDDAQRLDPTHPDLSTWQQRIDGAIAADKKAESEKREREEAEAREEAGRRDRQKRLDEIARQQAEQVAVAKAAAERARADADAKLASVQSAIDAGRFDEAGQLVAAARALDPSHPALGSWQQQIETVLAERQAADRARKVVADREKALQQEQSRQAAAATLALVKTALQEQRYQAARERLAEARLADPTHPELEAWAQKITRQEHASVSGPFAWRKPAAVIAVVGVAATVGTLVYRGQDRPTGTFTEPATVPAKQPTMTSSTQPPASTAGGTAPDNTVDGPVAAIVKQPPAGDHESTGRSTGPSEAPGGEVRPRGGGASRGRQTSAAPAGASGGTVPGATSGSRANSPPLASNQGKNPGTTATGRGGGTASATTPAGNNQPQLTSPPPGPELGRSGTPAAAAAQAAAVATSRETSPAPPTPEQLAEEQRARQLAEDEAAIRRLLPLYVEAYHDKDEARLRRMIPGFRGIPNKELIRSVTVRLGEPRIVINGRSATLLVAQTLEYQWERPGLPPNGIGTVTWNLEKEGSNWTIVSSNFR